MDRNLRHFVVRYWYLGLAALVLLAAGGALIFLQTRQGLNPLRVRQVPLNRSQSVNAVSAQPGGQPEMTAEALPFSIQLSEGKAQPQAVTPLPVATGQPLSQGEIDQILARVPPLPTQPGDQADFRLAQQPIPPPRPGETVKESFPPAPQAAQPPAVETGPLKVLRYSPEGEIPIAPFLSVTFNQAMVPLTTVEQLTKEQVPVRLEPDLPGTWRWMGTRTLTFEYDSELIDRLPKATQYHVTVPAGTKSAAGNALAETVEWSFSTPPPKTTQMLPQGEPQPRDALFFIHFDQRINPEAVLKTIQVAANEKKFSLTLVSEAEIKANPKWAGLVKTAVEGRWLAFKANELLPANADILVTVGPGTPSAEGPLTTRQGETYLFRTYAPLRIENHGCNWGNDPCQPLAPFMIQFNNRIDEKAYTDAMITIRPDLPGASVNIYGNQLQIQGASKGQTTYTVTVSGSIQDVFGQTLGKDTPLEFKVGRAEPTLFNNSSVFMTLDPAAKKPVFSVYAINYPRLDVKIYRVQPSDWPAFKQYLQDFQRTDVPVNVPGTQVYNQTISVQGAADELSEINIDLSQVMDGAYGQFIVIVSPPKNLLKDPQAIYWQTIQTWVQITQIGLDAFTDQSDMVIWASALKDGAPLANLTVEAGPTGQKTVTGADGTARILIPNGASYLVARQGADIALLPRYAYLWGNDPWMRRGATDELRWHVFDDRQMYRPGEEVHVKGWLRRIGGTQDGDVALVGSGLTAVNYQVTDAQGNPIGSGQAAVSALGGFDLALKLPEQMNLGYTQVNFTASGSIPGIDSNQKQFNYGFQVQEFRRPEFEVTARNETSAPYFAGEHAVVAVAAKYYAGGPLPNAEVNWQVITSPGYYAPPNWPDFTFGEWVQWWSNGNYDKPYYPGSGETKFETFTGQTDAAGEHYLRLDFAGEGQPRPVSIMAEASVMDVNRQAWVGATTLLVHPASLYVGLRGQQIFVERGTPLKVDVIVTDLDGKPVADRKVEVRAARLDWKYRSGDWQEEEVDPQTCSIGSTDRPAQCVFQTAVGGAYRITATVTDPQGRKNQSSLTRWVSGGKMPASRELKQEMLTLIPDRQDYQPGDVAHILVQSPFSPAEGLLTIDRNGIIATRRFQVSDGTATLDIPIEEKYIPNLNIQVDVNGSAQRTDDEGNALPNVPARPAFATGHLILNIPPVQRTLSLEVKPAQSELEPGGETTLGVVVKDAAGKPVADAELAVVVVDEAILALTNYQLADPLATFYAPRPAALEGYFARSSVVLANPLALSQATTTMRDNSRSRQAQVEVAAAAPAAAQPTATASMQKNLSADNGMSYGAAPQPIRVRVNFDPLATFAPAVKTNSNGAATVAIKLPDNLTRYRVMVVAVEAGRRFGKGESAITARLPLMVRPSAPRFLNFGDRFELPVVLQNQTAEPMTVDVVVKASNLTLTAPVGIRVTIPARDRVEVRFPAAAQQAGTARLQVAAVAGSAPGSAEDAAAVELPVYTPATTEAFATYGVIDNGAVAQPVAAPKEVFPQFGGLEITTSSTAVQALTDAVLYLVSYPYDCSEQIASRVLAVASLRDVLTAFDAAGLPSPQEMETAVDRDVKTLQGLQNADGGFPYWRRGFDSIPFNTIHVAHALYRAKAKGFSVPADTQQRAMDYLRQIENHYPSYYSVETRRTLTAYALYVRHLMGDNDPNRALSLIREAGLENLSLDAIGWLWPVLQDAPGAGDQLAAIRTYVNNHAVETAGAANFTTQYDDQNYLLLGSDRRTDAILLDALIGDNSQHDLIPKLVNGLLAQRTQGRWMSTQENVFVLLALDRYFNTFEAQTPDFVAQIWLGETYAGSHEFRGRTTERSQTNVPMTYLVDPAKGGGRTQDLILNKDGAGRMYYRLGLRYAPTDLKQTALDMGFVVRRVYEAIDDPTDVRQDADRTWHIKAGARVRVHLTMVADNRRYHVALADPLPAGLEIVNPALAVSGSQPANPASAESRSFWWGPWYQHQNMRDERAEAFTPLLWDGVYQYDYIARATTPGTFVVPATKAEEMYSPEVFGRSASDVVIVE